MPLIDKSAAQGIALIQLLLIMVALLLLLGIGYLLLTDSLQQSEAVNSVSESQPQVISGSVADASYEAVSADSQPDIEPAPASVASGAVAVIESLRPSAPSTGRQSSNSVLPGLNQSDPPFRSALLSLTPDSVLMGWLINDELIRKLVVTIDNMADGKIPRKHALLQPMKDKFRASKRGTELWLDGYNHSRYNTYIALLSSVDPQQWLDLYQHYYPLMQRAYAELGYPRKAFHDRVLMAVDKLLDSPVVAKPLALEQTSVMYTFADQKLQQLSAVDKQMLRLGAVNARQLKSLLVVLRAKLALIKP